MPTPLKRLFLGGALLCAAAAGAEGDAAKSHGPVPELKDGFTLSSTRKDGKIEWKVEGSSGAFLSPNVIEVRDVRALYCAEDGTNMVATSSKAVVNQDTRQVTTDEFVTIVTENSVTTGTGMEWDQTQRRGTLKKNVKVVYTAVKGKELPR